MMISYKIAQITGDRNRYMLVNGRISFLLDIVELRIALRLLKNPDITNLKVKDDKLITVTSDDEVQEIGKLSDYDFSWNSGLYQILNKEIVYLSQGDDLVEILYRDLGIIVLCLVSDSMIYLKNGDTQPKIGNKPEYLGKSSQEFSKSIIL